MNQSKENIFNIVASHTCTVHPFRAIRDAGHSPYNLGEQIITAIEIVSFRDNSVNYYLSLCADKKIYSGTLKRFTKKLQCND